MSKSSADVEMEVEASRSELDRNVEALKDKMTPGQLFDEAMHSMGGAGQHIGSRLLEQVKENPMPLAVIGLGLAWLMAEKRGGASAAGASAEASYEPSRFAGADGSGETANSGLAARASGMASSVKDKARSAADQASSAIGDAKEKLASGTASMQQGVKGAVGKASDMTQRARDSVTDAYDSEPLLGVAAGFFVGMAIGAALPPTETENRLMGRTRDRLIDKGKGIARTGVEQASSAAQSAYEGAKSELTSGGEGGMVDKVAAALTTGVERAQAELKPH